MGKLRPRDVGALPKALAGGGVLAPPANQMKPPTILPMAFPPPSPRLLGFIFLCIVYHWLTQHASVHSANDV